MDGYHWKKHVESFDERREIVIPGDQTATIKFCIEHFIRIAEDAIKDHGYFSVALSGGSTPKAIYTGLSQEEYRDRIDWTRVLLFWSDERSVPPTSEESNYKMAMDSGFNTLPLSSEHIFRMQAEENIEEHALEYEKLVEHVLPNGVFDLVMLGMGEDGHTASLFPETHGLHAEGRLVVANYIPKLSTWRMTLTFDCINQAHHTAIYVIGKNKAPILKRVFSEDYNPDNLPIQKIGAPSNKALWIMEAGIDPGTQK